MSIRLALRAPFGAALLLAAAAATAQIADAMRAVPLASGEHIRLDGRLDHPAWSRAPVFHRFVERDPNFGAAPPQVTGVQVLFSRHAIYVGVTALETEPRRIRRPLVRTDMVNRTQDFVVVYLDPIGSRRSAQFFRVNAAGSRADGIHTAADDSEDFAPDFDWDAAVAAHPQGWTAVLRLPLASLRFAQGEQDSWRIMVGRRLPRQSFHLVTSVPVPRESTSFIDKLQPLQGLQLPDEHAFLSLRPSLTLRQAHTRDASGRRDGDSAVDASLDVKWRPRAELVIDGTLEPDFSQVALDLPQLTGNTRFALSIAEKRPFFFESADLLRTPTHAFYTRSFTAPRGGLRATWRGTRAAGSLFAIDDRGGGQVLLPGVFGTDTALQPGSRTLAGRMGRDEGGLQWGGVLAARRYERGRGDNTVLGPDLQWSIDPDWRLRAQWLHSRSSALPDGRGGLRVGDARAGDRLFLRLQREVQGGETTLSLDDIDEEFRHDSGFVGQAGVRRLTLFEGRSWRGVGPFHQFWVNLNAQRTEARDGGRTVEQQVYPGLWVTAAHNLEGWLELRLLSQLRATASGPLLAQRYLASGLVFTPATWFPLLDTQLSLGRLADMQDERVRPGLRWSTRATLRPLARLELEPSWSASWLRGSGHRVYDERLFNLLTVWHLGPRSHLRAIVQHTELARGGDGRAPLLQRKGRTASLTWSLRLSSGTVVYAGASEANSGVGRPARTREAFFKLQADLDDARAGLGAP